MIELFNCEQCKCVTPHKEDTVPDRSSATVWHCLICGEEKPPKGGNAFVEKPKPSDPVLVGGSCIKGI